MRLTDELKRARDLIHVAMGEQLQHDDARCAGAGRRTYGEKPSFEGLKRARRGAKLRP